MGGRGRGRGRGTASAAADEPSPPGGLEKLATPPPDETTERLSQLSVGKTEILQRPHYGTAGRQVAVDSNYFELAVGGKGDKSAELVVQRYQIELKECKRKIDRDEQRVLFWRMVQKYADVFGGNANAASICYDDSNAAISLNMLRLDGREQTFEVDVELARDNRPFKYQLTVKHTGSVLVDLKSGYDAEHADRSTTPQQALSMILTQYLRCPLFEKAQSWYPWGTQRMSLFRQPNGNVHTKDLGGGREMWTGMHVTAKIGENWKPLLNVDVAHTAFYKRMSVIDYFCEVMNAESNSSNYHRSQLTPIVPFTESWSKALSTALKGVRIRTTHLGEHNRVYRFTSVGMLPADLKFENINRETGVTRTLSVLEHFTERGHPIQLPNLPCLNLGPRQKPMSVPMEFCEIDPHPQKVLRKLTDKQTADMIRAAATKPQDRQRKLMSLTEEADFQNDPFMRSFGIRINTQMFRVPARQLPPPTMLYGQNATDRPREGQWRGTARLYQPASNIRYALIVYNVPDDRMLLEFCRNLVAGCKQHGLQFDRDMPEATSVKRVNGAGDVQGAIKELFKSDQPNLIIVPMARRDSHFYSEVKRWSEIEVGVMTQCLLRKQVEAIAQGRSATVQNVVLKVNMKLGGVNTAVEVDQVWKKFQDEPTLFLGVDVTHPGPFESEKPSIAAVVGSVDIAATKYGASIKVQKFKKETIVYLTNTVKERLMDFYQKTHRKPERIVVLRDGVSEGQFIPIMREEMANVRDACRELDSNYRPKITYIVVQKRHHTRFFPSAPGDASRSGNIQPGTVVDRGVTHPCEFDFFLCSHAGIQGTSRPTHYFVLHDDSDFKADELQMAMFQLTHLFGRCARSVSIPAPVYFADLCCTRARYHYQSRFGSTSSGSTHRRDGTSVQSSEEQLMEGLTVLPVIKDLMYWS